MNNLKKFLPLFTLILGIGLVFTQSAFKSASDAEYGLHAGVWYNLADAPPSGKQYDCEQSEMVCTKIYRDGAPDQGGTFVADTDVEGTFRLIDIP